MSLIQFRQDSEGRYIVFCPLCHKQVMVAPMSEIADLVNHNIVPICFDCSDLGIDNVPPHLMSALDVYLLAMGDATFLAFWRHHNDDGEYELRCQPINTLLWYCLKTGDVRRIAPLSSNTYLHNSLNISGGKNE